MEALGTHWLAHASGCDPRRLADAAVVEALLAELVAALSLTAVAPIEVRTGEAGLVGMVLLGESHASVHTVTARGEAFVDVFSCVARDFSVAGPRVREALGAQELSEQVVRRGGR